MLNVETFKKITKVINSYGKKNFNYIDLLYDLSINEIPIKRYKVEKYFFFLKKWKFVDNINGKRPFILLNEIPDGMVKYLCNFTDLNEREREELKNKYFRREKLKKVKSKINI